MTKLRSMLQPQQMMQQPKVRSKNYPFPTKAIQQGNTFYLDAHVDDHVHDDHIDVDDDLVDWYKNYPFPTKATSKIDYRSIRWIFIHRREMQ